MKKTINVLVIFGLLLLLSCSSGDDSDNEDPMGNDPTDDLIMSDDDPMQEEYTLQTFVTGLTAPQGIEIDGQGLLWVAEQGTGAGDGQVSVIDQNGQVYPFLTNIPSVTQEGSAGSAHHR